MRARLTRFGEVVPNRSTGGVFWLREEGVAEVTVVFLEEERAIVDALEPGLAVVLVLYGDDVRLPIIAVTRGPEPWVVLTVTLPAGTYSGGDWLTVKGFAFSPPESPSFALFARRQAEGRAAGRIPVTGVPPLLAELVEFANAAVASLPPKGDA